jgi:hypothetical protein
LDRAIFPTEDPITQFENRNPAMGIKYMASNKQNGAWVAV